MIPIPILRAAVIVMGILIIAGLVVIGIKIYQKSNEAAESMTAEALDTPATTTSRYSVSIEQLGLGPGARLISMDVEDERLVLRVHDDASGKERVVIVDMNSGAVLGEIAVPPALQ